MLRRKNNTRRRARFDSGDSASFHRSRTISGYQPVDDSAAEAVVLERQAELRQSSQRRRSVRILAVVALVVGIIGLLASQLVLNVSSVQYQPASLPGSEPTGGAENSDEVQPGAPRPPPPTRCHRPAGSR